VSNYVWHTATVGQPAPHRPQPSRTWLSSSNAVPTVSLVSYVCQLWRERAEQLLSVPETM
jgi:hypothetical protein